MSRVRPLWRRILWKIDNYLLIGSKVGVNAAVLESRMQIMTRDVDETER